MNENGGADDLNLLGVEFKLVVDVLDEVLGLGQGVVAFPVAADQKSSDCHFILF